MNHLSEARLQALLNDELGADEAEHLATCSACEARWAHATTPPWLAADICIAAAPAHLLPQTLARFDEAHGAVRAGRRRMLLGACALVHALALTCWLLVSASGDWLLARVAVTAANALTLLAVAGRIALHFPVAAAVHLSAVALCAVMFALLWAHAWRSPHAAASLPPPPLQL